jgi:hypothetical protein
MLHYHNGTAAQVTTVGKVWNLMEAGAFGKVQE